MSATALPLAYADPVGRGTPLLLVHGFSHDRTVWEPLARGLPPGIRPIAVDLRGHGASPWSPEGAYAPEDYAADLPALLEWLGIARAWVVGHSLGGCVAAHLAARWPGRVAGLVLVDASPVLRTGGGAAVAEGVGERLRSFASVDEHREALARVHPLADPALLARLARRGLVRRLDGRWEPALDPGILGAGRGADDLAAVEREVWEALAAVSCPVRLVRGGTSAVLSEDVAEAVVRAVRGPVSQVTLPDAGHAVMLDDPQGLARVVRDFVPCAAAA